MPGGQKRPANIPGPRHFRCRGASLGSGRSVGRAVSAARSTRRSGAPPSLPRSRRGESLAATFSDGRLLMKSSRGAPLPSRTSRLTGSAVHARRSRSTTAAASDSPGSSESCRSAPGGASAPPAAAELEAGLAVIFWLGMPASTRPASRWIRAATRRGRAVASGRVRRAPDRSRRHPRARSCRRRNGGLATRSGRLRRGVARATTTGPVGRMKDSDAGPFPALHPDRTSDPSGPRSRSGSAEHRIRWLRNGCRTDRAATLRPLATAGSSRRWRELSQADDQRRCVLGKHDCRRSPRLPSRRQKHLRGTALAIRRPAHTVL